MYRSMIVMGKAPAAAQRTYILGAMGGFTTMAYLTWASLSKDSECDRVPVCVGAQRARARASERAAARGRR